MAAINIDLHTKTFVLNAHPELKVFSQKLSFQMAFIRWLTHLALSLCTLGEKPIHN